MADPGQDEQKVSDRRLGRQLVDGLDATMERMRKSPLRATAIAVLIIWWGVCLLLYALDKIDTPQKGWAIFAWGAGAVALIETLLRLIVPKWREPVMYSFVWGVVGVAVGFSLWYDSWDTLGPIGIIGLGLLLVATVAMWQRKGLSKALEERIKRVREAPVRFVAVSVLVVWFGVSLLLNAMGAISARVTPEVGGDVSATQIGWAIFALGGAGIFVLETLVRLILPRWRQPVVYSFLWGLVWLAVGLSLYYNNWKALAPIVFIGLGLALIGLLLPKPAK
jgi:uncharacterized membrane protein YidH (DUF202 family)